MTRQTIHDSLLALAILFALALVCVLMSCRTDATVKGLGSDQTVTAERDAVTSQVVNQLWPVVVMVSVLSIPVSVALAIVLYTGVVRPRRLAKSVSVTEAAK